jgi:tRNA nucleotidyltransferase (CCA-adding enzyme)
VVNNTQYKSALNNKIFEVISQASQELNVDSYVIGGFVRDLILNRDFKKDIDIVAWWHWIKWQGFSITPKPKGFKTYGTAMLRFEDTDIEFVGAERILF